MLFSTPIFLFLFLPAVLVVYFVAPRPARNLVLLAASLLFYAWGEPAHVLVMLASIGLNYVCALAVARAAGGKRADAVLAAAVALNLAILVYFKYAGFLVDALNDLLALLALPAVPRPDVVMPIGISFFTFQAMSYVVDVYRGQVAAERNPFNVALYVSLFPQLIAGPIVRYVDVAAEIRHRRVTVDGFALGIQRFIIGLAKKRLLADTAAAVATAAFDVPDAQLTAGVAWLGLVCYTLQIYFDFSGYSDMAIGLGLMFGFRFLENFHYPYIALSLTEFWRRWHISLSTWFRDYLYIPLGGNRRAAWRTYANLLIVFLLCGLWHGASWNFVAWGLFHGTFLVLERQGLSRLLQWAPRPLRQAYLLLVVMVGWVLFRAETLDHAAAYLGSMFGLGPAYDAEYHVGLYLDSGMYLVLAAGIAGSTPWLPWSAAWMERWRTCGRRPAFVGGLYESLRVCLLLAGLAASAAWMLAGTQSPFIYFRF